MVVGWRLDVGGAVSVEDISDESCDRSDPSAKCRGSNNLGRSRFTIHGSRSMVHDSLLLDISRYIPYIYIH
jgi:hypothetical protein